jgi:hypothetical protein
LKPKRCNGPSNALFLMSADYCFSAGDQFPLSSS